MAAKKATRAKSRKSVTRAKATKKSSRRSARKAPKAGVERPFDLFNPDAIGIG